MSRMTFRSPPGVSAPAPPKNIVHFGSVIAFSRTEAQRPKVRAWNEIRLYPSTRSATDVVFSGPSVRSGPRSAPPSWACASPCPAQCGHLPKGFGSSGFLLPFDRFRDGAGLLFRPGAGRVLVAGEEHVEVGVLPLDVLDPLHDVLEGDRLVVRVDPHDDPFLALHPHGPPLFGRPRDTVRFVRAYKYSSGRVRPCGPDLATFLARAMIVV